MVYFGWEANIYILKKRTELDAKFLKSIEDLYLSFQSSEQLFVRSILRCTKLESDANLSLRMNERTTVSTIAVPKMQVV